MTTFFSQEEIVFDDNYVNPCWSEIIPKFPYLNNSYLDVSDQAKVIEPQFSYMRKKFATRQGPSNNWRLRCLPAFYVMETPPLSPVNLYQALSYHPTINTIELPEPEFWNQKGPGRSYAIQCVPSYILFVYNTFTTAFVLCLMWHVRGRKCGWNKDIADWDQAKKSPSRGRLIMDYYGVGWLFTGFVYHFMACCHLHNQTLTLARAGVGKV